MKLLRRALCLAALSDFCIAVAFNPVLAQSVTDSAASGQLAEIVVTAEKRAESINAVGMSISALTADQLTNRGVTDVADLEKVVPGFSYAQAPNARPVFTLRGVGFYDTSLAASPTTSVYVDEVPLPFSIMTRGADLDLQRVEILKGPQGTLFGENSTGGAINFIAAKPTDKFESGFDASIGSFARTDVTGFASGPLTDSLNARVAIRTTQGNGWQYNYTTPGERTGAPDFNEGRLLLDWAGSEHFKLSVNVNGYLDRSQNQAPQLIAIAPQVPGVLAPGVLAYPLPPANDRAASWGPETAYDRDDRFLQGALRAQYDLSNGDTLISITSFEKYEGNGLEDYDGMTYQDLDIGSTGWVSTVNQELRYSHASSSINWIAGGNFEHDRTYDQETLSQVDASNTFVGPIFANPVIDKNFQDIHTYAAFGNVDISFSNELTAHAGARFTQTNRIFTGCSADAGNGTWAAADTFLAKIFTGAAPNPPVLPGGCITFNADFVPGPFVQRLDQNNVSWRTGLDWKPGGMSLIYGNISRGYKAGSFPTEAALTSAAYHGVPQESLIAYEIGAKAPFLDNTLRITSALFYYDYLDKQLRGVTKTPFIGVSDALISVPKSHVEGAELSVEWVPIKGLQLTAAATYIKSRITNYTGLNEAGVESNFEGSRFPFAPALETVADGQYSWDAWSGYSTFVGFGATHHSQTNAGIGDSELLNIKAYTLLDLRAGIQTPDSKWKLTLWGRNVTDNYYWTNATHANDTYIKFAGMPATFGVAVGYRY